MQYEKYINSSYIFYHQPGLMVESFFKYSETGPIEGPLFSSKPSSIYILLTSSQPLSFS